MGEQPVRVTEMYLSVNNAQLCASGFHAWVPWLTLPNGSYHTWCVRHGCDERQQYDDHAAPTGNPTDPQQGDHHG